MEQEPTVNPETEARFQALAGSVDQETWSKLINFTSDRMLRRLALAEVVTEVDPDKLQAARVAMGEMLVEYTNAVLTAVAEGEARR